MGRNKTRKKQNRNQPTDDQDPDISEAEPSSSENASSSLTDTLVLSNSNSTNVMDTDIEDSELTTGNSTPADEDDPNSGSSNGKAGLAENHTDTMTMKVKSDSGNTPGHSDVNSWLDNFLPKPSCPHVKASASIPGLRKAMKNDISATCSSRPCKSASSRCAAEIGAGDSAELPKEITWICLQCGNFGCGNATASNGDAELHSQKPRSDSHNIVVKIDEEMNACWCFVCKTFIDGTNASLKPCITFIKKNHNFKLAMQPKTQLAPAIALGPPPPPPQPQVDTTHLKSSDSKNKMNTRNKITPYSSSWDSAARNSWPMGLDNLGNTCFMNSALQCLSRTKSLIPKLDLYGTGNTLEIVVTAEPPSVDVIRTMTAETNGDKASLFFELESSERGFGEENGESNHILSSSNAEAAGTGGSSPSSSDMDSLLDVASGSSKSSPSKEIVPSETFKAEIEKELKKSLRLKLVIPKDSMTSRLRLAFKAMTRSADAQPQQSYSSNDYFGRHGRHVYTPSSIHSSMAKHFRPGQQHDSHELLRTVVDMMKKDQIKAFRLAIMDCYGIKKTEGKNCDPKTAELLKMWDRKLYHKTFVDEIFGGELVTFSKCLTCGDVRRSYEDFLDISLPIRVYTRNQIPKRGYSLFDDDGDSHRSLEDCLKSFTEPEQLAGSNAVECEKCHRANLAKLEAGMSFEDVFPGVKPPAVAEARAKTPEPEPEPVLETEVDGEGDGMQPLLMDEEETPQEVYDNATEDMDDLDEPAVDGIVGSTSDMEDEGNGVPPVFLDVDDKEVSTMPDFHLPNKDSVSLSIAVTHDEGFSESDSSEEKKSASISASSSRNSISEAENGPTLPSSSKQKEGTKPIPITKCPCSRHQMVLRPPECLTVHLKRFQITSHGTSKLSDHINFPYILDLTPFCAREEEDLQRLDGKDVYDEDGEVMYALYGIVEHSGSLHWGHYVAYIKVSDNNSSNSSEEEPEGDKTNDCEASESGASCSNSSKQELTEGKWFYISDSSVSPSSLGTALGMDPYILFYERIRGQDKKEKLSRWDRLNNQSAPAPVSSYEPTTDVESSTTTNGAAGCSFDFSLKEL